MIYIPDWGVHALQQQGSKELIALLLHRSTGYYM